MTRIPTDLSTKTLGDIREMKPETQDEFFNGE